MIQPLRNLLFIEEIHEDDTKTTASGIIVHTEAKDRNRKGVVRYAGKGLPGVKSTVKVGDTVLYTFGTDVKLYGKEYTVLAEHDVIAILTDNGT